MRVVEDGLSNGGWWGNSSKHGRLALQEGELDAEERVFNLESQLVGNVYNNEQNTTYPNHDVTLLQVELGMFLRVRGPSVD